MGDEGVKAMHIKMGITRGRWESRTEVRRG